MTFNTRKWFLFSAYAGLFLVLFLLFYFFVSDQSKMFKIHLDNTATINSNEILAYTKLSQEQDLSRELKSIYSKLNNNFRIAYIFKTLNKIPNGKKIFITSDEYNFLNSLILFFHPVNGSFMNSENNKEYQFGDGNQCSKEHIDVDFISCLPYLNNIFSVSTEISNGQNNFFLQRNAQVQILIKNPELITSLYHIFLLNEFLVKKHIVRYVIHINGLVLSQESNTKQGWAVQYDTGFRNIYYLYNELVYLPVGEHTKEKMVLLPVKYGTEISIIDFLSTYNHILNIGSFGKVLQITHPVPPVVVKKPTPPSDDNKNKDDD